MILTSGIYPSDWKIGYIKTLFKKGKSDDPSNYRGINIIPCVAKRFNCLLNKGLQSFSDRNHVINPAQIGVQPQSRTSDHLFVLRTLIEKFKANKHNLYACFVDL